MQSKASTVEQYISELPDDRKNIISEIRNIIKKNLPSGFEEGMGYGMIGFYVPHRLYPKGYHCDPKLPLPFIGVASQKNHIAIYHMGLYSSEKLMEWFTSNWKKHSAKKLDIGKSCLRFKKPEEVPFELIAKLSKKVSVDDWIKNYEAAFVKK